MNVLGSQFPKLHDRLPFLPLAELPTPVDSADKLAGRAGLQNLTIKRDDLAGKVYGGNKVRKLEYLLGDALDRNCDSVVTFGAAGSNHVLATAVYARQHGLKCYGILIDQAAKPYVNDTLRYHALLGTELIPADGYWQANRVYEETIARHPTGPERVYKIAWGGTSWLGNTGFVNAGLELAAQVDSEPPDVIYLPSGSLGTTIGLALGLRVAGLSTRLVAVKVVPSPATAIDLIKSLYEKTNNELHDRDSSFPIMQDPLKNVEIREGFIGPGYAELTEECLQAVDMIRESENIKLDTTYTGKALAALIHDAGAGKLDGLRVLFWNTYNSRPYPNEINAIASDKIPEAFGKYLTD